MIVESELRWAKYFAHGTTCLTCQHGNNGSKCQTSEKLRLQYMSVQRPDDILVWGGPAYR